MYQARVVLLNVTAGFKRYFDEKGHTLAGSLLAGFQEVMNDI